ncbi:MAG: pilus assembly protein TadG-related protein [Myxococcales bacterium]
MLRLRSDESGGSAVTVAIALLALGGFMALVLNIGHLMAVRGQLQNACDAAALAGAQELDGTPQGLSRARALAVDFASRHDTDRGIEVAIDPATDVVLGTWRASDSSFTPLSESAPNAPRLINALQVQAGREADRGNPLSVYFPVFLGGRSETSVSASAIAARGAPCDGCSIPLVFADCLVLRADGSVNCGETLVFRSDTTDNVGFSLLQDGVRTVSTSGIINVLHGTCTGVDVGDDIGVGNGNQLNNNVVKAFEDYRALHGSHVTVPIVSPPNGCPAKFNGLLPVVGFASFTITAVTGPPNQSISIRLDCEKAIPSRVVGCGFFGTVSEKPALVH